MLERLFKLKEHGSTVPVEILAGVATFLTSSYVLIVNPGIMSAAGMPVDALFSATAYSIILSCLLIGFCANRPFMLAPGMGINAFFAYSVVIDKGYSWREALTAVLLSGVLFVLFSAFGLREALLRSVPHALRQSMTVSLGFMIAVIGMTNCGIIRQSKTFLTLGNITAGPPMLGMLGIVIIGALVALRFKSAMLIGIAAVTLLGIPLGVTNYAQLAQTGIWSSPPSVSPIAMAFTMEWRVILSTEFIVITFTFLAIDIFDSLGTFMGVLNNFSEEEMARYQPRIPAALMCDALGTVVGACLGTSTVTAYVESSTGVAAGGRTGLTAIVIALLTVVALFFSPLFLIVPAAATAPALVVVGMYMMALSNKINFSDVTEGLPAVVGIVITALTWSISDGLMFSWIAFVVFKICAGKAKELNLLVVTVGVFFLARAVFLHH